MHAPSSATPDSCREQALRLLNRRPYSVAGLKLELLRRHYSLVEILPLLEDFVRLKLLDDALLAEQCLQRNQHSHRPDGMMKLKQKLLRQGIADTTIEQAIRSGDPEEDQTIMEYNHAKTAAQQKWVSLSRHDEPRAARMKLYRHLVGRGFPLGICWTVIREITDCRLAPEEDLP